MTRMKLENVTLIERIDLKYILYDPTYLDLTKDKYENRK